MARRIKKGDIVVQRWGREEDRMRFLVTDVWYAISSMVSLYEKRRRHQMIDIMPLPAKEPVFVMRGRVTDYKIAQTAEEALANKFMECP